jgi:hypothetical protein
MSYGGWLAVASLVSLCRVHSQHTLSLVYAAYYYKVDVLTAQVSANL